MNNYKSEINRNTFKYQPTGETMPVISGRNALRQVYFHVIIHEHMSVSYMYVCVCVCGKKFNMNQSTMRLRRRSQVVTQIINTHERTVGLVKTEQ